MMEFMRQEEASRASLCRRQSVCFRQAVRMNHTAADRVNIIERRRESNFSSNKLQNHVSVIRKPKESSKQTRQARVR